MAERETRHAADPGVEIVAEPAICRLDLLLGRPRREAQGAEGPLEIHRKALTPTAAVRAGWEGARGIRARGLWNARVQLAIPLGGARRPTESADAQRGEA